MSNATVLSQALIAAEELFASLKRDAGLELLGATPVATTQATFASS